MNVDRVFQTLNRHEVAYLVIGGMAARPDGFLPE
jgi:hypothetical protein